ncbi:MAG: hypothetical protein VB021_06995 [Oscillospiraceae bacterium]|nr:hypothetical protein [Oscillospiraceae bacterium]
MKRLLCVLLCAALALSFAGCGGAAAPQTDAAADAADAVDTSLLWSALSGVWVGSDGYFILFGSEGGGLQYTTGILQSGLMLAGSLTSAEKTGENAYALTVDFPAVAAFEDVPAQEARTATVSLTCHLTDDPKTIDATNIAAANGGAMLFTYAGKTLAEVSGTAAAGAGAAQPMEMKDAWSRFGGIWFCKDNTLLRFCCFSVENGVCTYSTGVLFSGESAGGMVTVYEDDAAQQTLHLTVDVPAITDVEVIRDAMTLQVAVDYSRFAEGILSISNADGEAAAAYRYAAADFEHLPDYESLLKM